MRFFSKAASIIFFYLVTPMSSEAALQCGNFYLKADSTGLTHINGQPAETQKITFLKAANDYDNVKIQWMLPSKSAGRWLGLDYVRQNGKPILNVEVVRMNMDASRQFWTYDCKRVK